MPWDGSANCGFTTGEPWLPLGADHAEQSIEAQRRDPASMLTLTRTLLELRRREPALSVGDWAPLVAEDHVLAYARTWGERRFVVALNLGAAPGLVSRSDLAGRIALSTHPGRTGQRSEDRLELAGDEAVIIATE
jgi:alpha-glucosidase